MTQLTTGSIPDLAAGGVCAWQLPPDPSCAPLSRSLLRAAMTSLGLGDDLIDAAVLAVSEQATNSLQHGLRTEPYDPVVPAELWVWARATPARHLVVTVFDTCRTSWPTTPSGDLLDEHGKGVAVIGAVADGWGAHLSRSRLGAWRVPGKAVWSAFALPGPWPDPARSAPPSTTARHLASALSARGAKGVRHHHERGVSLVSVPLAGRNGVNVWIESRSLTFIDRGGTRVHRALTDLQDLAEHLVRRIEESREERQRFPGAVHGRPGRRQ
jgi:Histidine kinase-like ATPase domain